MQHLEILVFSMSIAILKKALKNIDKLSIHEFSLSLRRSLTGDFQQVDDLLRANKDKLLQFASKHLSKARLDEIGRFLYVLHVASPEVFKSIVNTIREKKSILLSKVRAAKISEVAEFLSGISYGENIEMLVRLVMNMIREQKIMQSLGSINDFITYLGLAKRDIASNVLTMLLSDIERDILEILKGSSLKDIAIFFNSVNKIDRDLGIKVLNKYREILLDVFSEKIVSTPLEEIFSSIMLIAQVDAIFAKDILTKNLQAIGDRAPELLKFIAKSTA